MLLSPSQAQALLTDAFENHYAILAVNADSPAAVLDCLEAAALCDSPMIIETSLWQLTGRSFGAGDPFLGISRYAEMVAGLAESSRFAGLPVILHTDHIKGPNTPRILEHAIIAGYSTLSLDSSELSERDNITLIRGLCDYADNHGVTVTLEMEAGVDDGLTPLETAKMLLGEVERSHPGDVWLWAPGVGTRHGLSPEGYPSFSAAHVEAHAKLAREITGRNLGIALHGSSGLSETALKEAVQAGVNKVNWSSESLLIRSTAAKEYYASSEEQLGRSHPKWKETAMDNGVQTAISKSYLPRVCERIKALGATGQAKRFLAPVANAYE